MPLSVICLLFITQVFLHSSLALQIWSKPEALPTAIPAACRAALSANINCSPRLISAGLVAAQVPPNESLLNSYCTASCYESLTVRLWLSWLATLLTLFS